MDDTGYEVIMDINKVWISGIALTQPILTKLPSSTPIASFILQVSEHFITNSSHDAARINCFEIETLGKSANKTMDKVRQGQRYIIDGYLRENSADGRQRVKVRTFAIYPDKTYENFVFHQGVEQAVKILKKSRDLKTALETLEGMVAATD
jgi:single-stranded DNA-binding protein